MITCRYLILFHSQNKSHRSLHIIPRMIIPNEPPTPPPPRLPIRPFANKPDAGRAEVVSIVVAATNGSTAPHQLLINFPTQATISSLILLFRHACIKSLGGRRYPNIRKILASVTSEFSIHRCLARLATS